MTCVSLIFSCSNSSSQTVRSQSQEWFPFNFCFFPVSSIFKWLCSIFYRLGTFKVVNLYLNSCLRTKTRTGCEGVWVQNWSREAILIQSNTSFVVSQPQSLSMKAKGTRISSDEMSSQDGFIHERDPCRDEEIVLFLSSFTFSNDARPRKETENILNPCPGSFLEKKDLNVYLLGSQTRSAYKVHFLRNCLAGCKSFFRLSLSLSVHERECLSLCSTCWINKWSGSEFPSPEVNVWWMFDQMDEWLKRREGRKRKQGNFRIRIRSTEKNGSLKSTK